MKERSIPLYIVLSIVTCGIFGLYWFVCLTDDTNEASGQDLTGGVLALVLTIITCNIYGWFWAYKLGEKVDIIKEQNGQPASNYGILFVIMQALGLGIVNFAIAQDALNNTSVDTE